MQAIVVALSLALGAATTTLAAQGLPDYGIARVQTAPGLSAGSFPSNAVAYGDQLLILWVGWDTTNIYTRGAFFDLYGGGTASRTLLMDSAQIRSLNDFEVGSATVYAEGVAAVRNADYDPVDFNLPSSGSASILEYVDFSTEPPIVHHVDTLWIDAELTSNESNGFGTYPARQFTGGYSAVRSGLDTLHYCFTAGFNTARPDIVQLRSYVADSSTGLRLARSLEITDNVAVDDFQIGSWVVGDTLGRMLLVPTGVGSGNDVVAAFWDRHTGRYLGRETVARDVFRPDMITSERNGLGYVHLVELYWPEPSQPQLRGVVHAFDQRTGRVTWRRNLSASPGHDISYIRNVSRVDTAGRVLLTAFPEGIYRSDLGGRTKRSVVVAVDALTGDSLWRTTLRLDSFATETHDIGPVDIAVRSQGKGYVVPSLVVDVRLDPQRDLRYSYTALFFLDSLGCLAPGCRNPTSTGDPDRRYEIVLAPNPTRSGGVVRVTLPEGVSAIRYTLTDGAGRVLSADDARSRSGGGYEIPIPSTTARGVYYVTIWPDGPARHPVSTRVVVVQ